jgi:uncharacterized protein (TIGR00299 family) protein
MSRVMYLDCFSGAAGDMMLGAFLDAGLPQEALRRALGSLGVGHTLVVRTVLRAGLTATHVSVDGQQNRGHEHGHDHKHSHEHEHTHEHEHHHEHDHGPIHEHAQGSDHGHRSLAEISRLIESSSLSAAGQARALALFRRLAEAEAAIHGISVEQVHLHEVGALDSIIDIVGAVFAFEWFGIDDIVASPLNVGGGTVAIAHGTFPVPAPATLRLLTGVPVYSSGARSELLTPTGALLVSDYARSYGPMPAMTIERVGYGAGTRDVPQAPNVLRIVIGSRADREGLADGDGAVVKLECEIDDMSPQLFGPAVERLSGAGALDVFLTPVQMKKGRPGTLVTVLAPPDRRDALVDLLFRETTSIGVRVERVERVRLDRRWVDVAVTGGVVRIKVAGRGGEVLNAAPEFDDCVRVATATGRPVKLVQAEAVQAWLELHGTQNPGTSEP